VKVKSALATPEAIYKSNIKNVFDAGYTTPAKVCTGSYAALCQQAGITQ
jgi:D-xylose transport system substrate-binding protein